MKLKSTILATVGALAAFASAAPAMATSTAFTLIPSTYSNTGFSAWTLGTKFSPNTDLIVTALGDYFPTNATNTTGSAGIWDANHNLLASVTVTDSNTAIDNFTYGSITPLTLLAGQIYYVGGTSNGNLYACCSNTFYTVSPDITYLSHVEVNGTTLQFPSNSFTSFTDFGGNFQYTTLNVGGAVPEPATWALMLLGFGMVGAAVRKRVQKVSYTFG